MEISGALLLNKPAGVTSHDCVNKIRRLYNTKKVGHTGTLDPMATGVLPILIGRAAKASEFLTAESKKYRAGLRLGITTDTEDTTGRILTVSDSVPNAETVEKICGEFVGEIMQIPPMYSALKVGGQKLVDLARQGKSIERAPRHVTVYSITVTAGETPSDYILDVSCSKGTYIRTLCADIGGRLGCGGTMSSLERRASGGFDISECVSLEDLEKMTEGEREAIVKPTESLFSDLPKVRLPQFFERLSRDGNEIYQRKIGTSLKVGARAALYGKEGFFALGEVREYPAGSALKVIKLFVL